MDLIRRGFVDMKRLRQIKDIIIVMSQIESALTLTLYFCQYQSYQIIEVNNTFISCLVETRMNIYKYISSTFCFRVWRSVASDYIRIILQCQVNCGSVPTYYQS